MPTLAGIKAAAKLAANAVTYRNVETYQPKIYEKPQYLLDQISAWKGHEYILADIIQRFNLGTKSCLEFGVEFGFSTVALSNYFEEVTGVDIFTGDVHAGIYEDHYEKTKDRLSFRPGIKLFKADYRDWIKDDDKTYDLIHVDIIHTYEATYDCGLWSAKHSTCTLFHDTESFPEVKRAVHDIARATGKKFYNFPFYFGLGIIV